MVHFPRNIFSNCPETSASVLVTQVNPTKTRKAGFLIFQDLGRVKCEYYNVALPLQPGCTCSTANLLSALEFWQDFLSFAPGPVFIISDVDQNNFTRGIRIVLHQMKLKRLEKKLQLMKNIWSGKRSLNSRDDKKPDRSELRCLDDGMEFLLRGSQEGCESFKERIRTVIDLPVQFIRIA